MKLRLIFPSFLIIFLSFYLAACTPVKVQQGNLLPKSRIERLHVGMTKQEVERVMGTSLLMTPFSDNHWDYAYTYRLGNGTMTKKHLVLDFEGDTLARISTNE
jgi:outer membrane protein assembly factor BamE